MVCYCTPGLVVLPCHTRSVVWHRAIGSHGTIAAPVKWTTVLALHYSHTVATCPHVLQALTALPTRTSCRPMKALMPSALEMCASALGTCGPSCTSRPTRLFFLHEARGPQGTTGRVAARSPPSREAGSKAVGHMVLRSPPSGSGATVHMVVPEPFSLGRRVPEPLDTWQSWSPPQLRCRVRC
jgi:hypothetical protein